MTGIIKLNNRLVARALKNNSLQKRISFLFHTLSVGIKRCYLIRFHKMFDEQPLQAWVATYSYRYPFDNQKGSEVPHVIY